ncbi:MAG: hypothetical protein AB7V43_00310 [Acidimicrobiia bacterium]
MPSDRDREWSGADILRVLGRRSPESIGGRLVVAAARTVLAVPVIVLGAVDGGLVGVGAIALGLVMFVSGIVSTVRIIGDVRSGAIGDNREP